MHSNSIKRSNSTKNLMNALKKLRNKNTHLPLRKAVHCCPSAHCGRLSSGRGRRRRRPLTGHRHTPSLEKDATGRLALGAAAAVRGGACRDGCGGCGRWRRRGARRHTPSLEKRGARARWMRATDDCVRARARWMRERRLRARGRRWRPKENPRVNWYYRWATKINFSAKGQMKRARVNL
jgi:hypothetical protein